MMDDGDGDGMCGGRRLLNDEGLRTDVLSEFVDGGTTVDVAEQQQRGRRIVEQRARRQSRVWRRVELSLSVVQLACEAECGCQCIT